MLVGFKCKKIPVDRANPRKTTRKLAGESVYLALKLLFMMKNQVVPPSFDVYKLLKSVDLPPEQRAWVTDLIEKRIADKNAEYICTDEFYELIDHALSFKGVEDPDSPTQQYKKKMEL